MDLAPAAHDRLAVAGRAEPGRDLLGLADPETRRVDLGRLVLGELDPPDELARVDDELGERRAVRPPALDGPGDGLADHPAAAVGVEQVALRPLVEEPLLVVLAVDLDEVADRLGQPRRGHRLVVEPGRRPSAGADLADDDERLGQAIEQRLDPRDTGAVPDEPRVGARARGRARGRR